MISCEFFYNLLVKGGVSFYTGVPDSSLKDFCAYVMDNAPEDRHIIAANEGGAIALACGHFLATRQPALVYMQNSGQGNAINPLISLADPDVYGIPLLMLIGWRGQPGTKDEPQHVKQGKITLSLLEAVGIPYRLLPQEEQPAALCVQDAFSLLNTTQTPVAIVARKGTFETYQLPGRGGDVLQMSREEALQLVLENLASSDVIVSTTGKLSRELYEFRDHFRQGHSRDFLTVGSMGHSSQIALGIALAKPHRQVFCFDGDGAVIMHMGALAIVGSRKPQNFKHILFNNAAHDSVGGQPTAGFDVSFPDIARACGYKWVATANTPSETRANIARMIAADGPALLEIKVRKGARPDLGRPKTTPIENKTAFMEFLAHPCSRNI